MYSSVSISRRWGTPILKNPPQYLSAGRDFFKDGEGKQNKEIRGGVMDLSSLPGVKGGGVKGSMNVQFLKILPLVLVLFLFLQEFVDL